MIEKFETIQDFFSIGMKRTIPELLPPGEVSYNLGAGNHHIEGTTPLDYPDWDATVDSIPAEDGTIDTICAFHFLEHLDGDSAIFMLREIQRVLKVGGTANIVVPHRLSQMAYHDLDHKSFYCEETWRNLFNTEYYTTKHKTEPWLFRVNVNIIIGLNERNLALLTQLVRV